MSEAVSTLQSDRPVSRSSVSYMLRVAVIHATRWTVQLMQIVTIKKSFKNVGPNMIKNLLTLGMSTTVYRLWWSFMKVAKNHFASFHLLPISDWKHKQVHSYGCTCIWSHNYTQPRIILIVVARSFNEAVVVRCIRMVELVSSMLNNLVLGSLAIAEVLHSAERSGDVFGANADPPGTSAGSSS